MDPKSSDLPEWLWGVQAVAWLATADVSLTLGRRASPAHVQAMVDAALSKEKALVAKIWRDRAAKEKAEVRAITDVDDPREWNFSLPWLYSHIGDAQLVDNCCRALLAALKAGAVRAIRSKDKAPIPTADWIVDAVEDPFLPMVYDKGREEWQCDSRALFWRNDVVKLRERLLGHPISIGSSEISPPSIAEDGELGKIKRGGEATAAATSEVKPKASTAAQRPVYEEPIVYSSTVVPKQFKDWARSKHIAGAIITVPMAENAMRGPKDKDYKRTGGLLAPGTGLSRETIRAWVGKLSSDWRARQGVSPSRAKRAK